MRERISLSVPTMGLIGDAIHTERFLLRKPVLSDAGDIFAGYAQDDDVVRYLMWKKHPDLAATERFLQYCLGQWQGNDSTPYALVAKSSGKVVGMVDLRRKGHCINLGYVLAKSWWGKGGMTEVCQMVVRLLLTRSDIIRVGAVCDIANVGSARVLEKAGMSHEGILRAYTMPPNMSSLPRDVHCYSMIKQDLALDQRVVSLSSF